MSWKKEVNNNNNNNNCVYMITIVYSTSIE